MEDPSNEVIISAATAWEVATKFRLGRLPEAEVLVTSYDKHVATLGARELPVLTRHALTAGLFPVAHGDRFDRMLAAQALVEDLPLITKDPVFDRFPGVTTRW